MSKSNYTATQPQNQFQEKSMSKLQSKFKDQSLIESEQINYSIEAYVRKNDWPLSLANWDFLEDRRINQLREYLGKCITY